MESIPISPLSTSSELPAQGEYRDWLELPRDVTTSILLKLGAIEILTTAQKVCRLWRKICQEPSMWRTIDMRNLGDCGFPYNLEVMCRDAIDRSSGLLADITMEHFGTDELLRHITASASQLRRLRLACCPNVSDEGLAEAASKLPLLEDLELFFCYAISAAPLEDFGRCCPNLKSLKLNNQGVRNPSFADDEPAFAIAQSMPNLRYLMLFGILLTNDGLRAILDGCPHLESLDLRQCFQVNLQEASVKAEIEKITTVRHPDDSTNDYEFDNGDPGACDDYEAGSPYWFSDLDDFMDEEYDEFSHYGMFSADSDLSDIEGLFF